jgi:hypothetical protein
VTGGILGSSMLLSAVIDRRIDLLRDGAGSCGRRIRGGLSMARTRPPCIACTQGETAVGAAIGRFAGRSRDADWADALGEAAFCLDDFLLLWERARSRPEFEPVVRRQVARFEDLRRRLDGYAHHSSHDRIQLMTDEERTAADEATRVLGGDPP